MPRSTAGSPETRKGFPISVPWRAAVRRYIRSSIFAADVEQLEKLSDELKENPAVAVASSFIYNQEITAVEAQKGPVLKEYIESLGYTMDEVMVLGDSLNDYSMISMDFGATVAMENAVPEIKKAAKYITKSNNEFGVAYAIDQVLERQGK